MAGVKLAPILGLTGVVVVFLYVFNTMPIPGMSASIGPYFTALIPGLLLTFMGMVTAAETRSGPAMAGCFTVTGVGLAIILGAAHGAGMVSDAMLLPATLEQYQAIIIILSLLVGAFIGVAGEK